MKTRMSGRQQALNITDNTLTTKQDIMSRVDVISGDSTKSKYVASITILPLKEGISHIRTPSIYFYKPIESEIL